MKTTTIKNRETGEVMKTRDGKTLVENRLEEGDEFIPQYNDIIERTNEITDKYGKTKKITNYSLKCTVKDHTGRVIEQDGQKEIFVTLTPTQAKSLRKKIEQGIEINQQLFTCYEYESKNYGLQLGVGIKGTKKAKTFKDFEA